MLDGFKPIDRVREYGNQTEKVETSEFPNEPKIVWIGTNWKKSCENCQYSDLDYIFDDELGDEYPLYTCQKGNDVSLDFECKDFKEYKPKPYKEEDTRCDKCEYLHKCLKECQAEDVPYIDCTTMQDTKKHIVVGNVKCYKNKE